MRILITHGVFPPEITGGGETLILKLAKSLVKKGHFIRVVTSGDPNIKEYDGIRTIRIPINRYLMNLTTPIILKYAKNVDLIHTGSGNTCIPSWIVSKLLKKPISCMIYHIFGPIWKDVREGLDGSIFQFLEKAFLTRNYDAIVFLDEYKMRMGMKIGIDKNKSFVLNPGIDFKKFQLKNIKKEPFVLFVGSFFMTKSTVKVKGLEYLIEAAKNMPGIKFVIVGGGGDYFLSLRQMSPSNVTFTGPMMEKTLIELYNKALIFCEPSLTGVNYTLMEAMASGCGIISSIDIGQRGKIIRPKNTKDIIKAINYFMENPDVVKKNEKFNMKIVEKFTWKNFINSLIEVYNSIL